MSQVHGRARARGACHPQYRRGDVQPRDHQAVDAEVRVGERGPRHAHADERGIASAIAIVRR